MSSLSMGEAGIHYDDAAPPPGMRIYAVGDIHGRHDLMAEMHRRIVAEIMNERPQDWRIIYLGDYVDRGPASRQVLDFLYHTTLSDPRIVALAGNHDVGLLEFLAEPSADGLFARNGGDATARSYGVEIDLHSKSSLISGHSALLSAIPPAHLDFLRGLERFATFGDLFFSHAGIRPGIPLDRQSDEDLIWIRERFRNYSGLHPKLVVHGHTPQAHPEIMPNRVNLDTGAWQSGRLTAMMFEEKRKRLLEVRLG